MIESAVRMPGIRKNQSPAIAKLIAFIALSVLGSSTALPGRGQSQGADAAETPLSFETASIRPEEPGSTFNLVYASFSSGGYSASHLPLQALIKNAYGLDSDQISSLPKWAASQKYQIEARIDGETSYALSKLSGDELKLAHQRLLQSLLRDRFKLAAHNEPKQMPVYWLVIAKNGPKIRESKPGDQYADGIKSPSGNLIGPHMALVRLGGGRIAAQGLPIDNLVSGLTAQLGRKVIDKTGLTGNYDFTLEWKPDTGPTNGADEPGPSIFTAIQEQLGLRLEPHVGLVDVLVIDHVEMPSEN